MFIKLLLLFTLIPVLEIYVILQVGELLGALPTIGLIILTGVAGAYLARTQGFEVVRRMQGELNQGQLPAAPLIDAAMVLAGGLLLLTPGFCTDILGFSLLVPATRDLLKKTVSDYLKRQIDEGRIHIRRY
ncbi:FxsA family protein [Geoalkalibacter subterraneus]|jgi:UPF0716 protein FxsA|uniref:Exlusion protein FxsA n=1 Tax=Geoalkalibacter subterraneus TaxID=483547 RepID=A0A0B5FP64_9BACT|nr:FxsA family protein [Geoalkalibacter subterraneus]AJF06439.1 exlusion protein FxsA [Geoalkalibacter subterraneus]